MAEVAPVIVYVLLIESCSGCRERLLQAFPEPPTEAQIALALEAAGGMTCLDHKVVALELGGAPVEAEIERDP